MKKTGKNEEDVDANEPTRKRRNTGMEQHDQQDRNPAEAFDVCLKAGRSGGWPTEVVRADGRGSYRRPRRKLNPLSESPPGNRRSD
jgi:hypothetical protein